MGVVKKLSLTFLGIAIAVIFIFFSSSVSLITDWWFFEEVGYTEIFLKSLSAKVIVGLIAGIFTTVFLLSNLFLSIHSKIPWIATLPEALTGQPVSLNDRNVKKIGIIVSLIISFFIGLIASSSWQDLLKFLSMVSFGQVDPIFRQDVSFYVFSLPIYFLGLNLVKIVVLISLISCIIIYFLRGSINLLNLFSKLDISKLIGMPKNLQVKHTKSLNVDKKSRLHIGILLSLFLATIAISTHLSLYNLLISQSGPVFGAAFTDTNVMIPILNISVYVYGLASILALFYGISGKLYPLLGAISLTFIVSFSSTIIPSVFQKLIVAPNELVKETPFIKHNIAATRKAYGLDKVEIRKISADKPITSTDIATNNITIKNVRLWDRDPLLSTFSQIQEIRTYYEFASVDNDRYKVNDEIRQIMLSPRELASDSLPNKNWINERLTFTHGYGVAAGPVNQVTPEGLPVLFVKDLPPKSDVKELFINQPEVYYGEILNDYVLVKTKSKEFDYQKGEENVYTVYKGLGGVEINSLARRLLYSIKFTSLKLFLSSDITHQSRILYYRNLKERVGKIAPFLTFDQDPYLVIADNKLYWIMDGYTSTNQYPYSQPLILNGGQINYIRNSVKAVVDAYNGKVSFYLSDPNDPIINAYAKIFPKTFRPLSKMPKSLISHLRYPQDIFTMQTVIYTTYHMDDPQIFYNKEDQWEIPAIDESAMTPRHMIMKLPGESKEEFILMLPFTPKAKDNLSSWMVARNDDDKYGKLVVYHFPKDKLVFGPKQVVGRINQDAEIARQISLWDQRGSQVIQGPLLVIPIEESLVYVRPLYLKAEAGKIPELKRVIVAYQNKIAMEETLEVGLAKIFGTLDDQAKPIEESTVPTAPSDSPRGEEGTTKESLLQQATEAYEAAIRAQREGDWERYGDEIKRLGEILNNLNKPDL